MKDAIDALLDSTADEVPFDDSDYIPNDVADAEENPRTPTPLTRTTTLPEFPVDALPKTFADMVVAVADFTQTDAAMGGTVAIATIAAVVGGRVEVEPRAGYREPCNIWTLTVASPAERKSSVLAALVAPVYELERELVEKARPLIIEAATRRDIAERAAERTRKTVGDATAFEREELIDGAIADAQAAEELVVPPMPRLVADDVTPESMVSMLAEQGGRLAVISAEGGVFDIIAGRYNSAPNLDPWLKAHAGDTLRVDRKGRAAEFVPRPALTLAIMVQPRVLSAAARHDTFRGSGLLARFVYAMPPSTLGRRNVDPDPVPASVSAAYTSALLTLGRNVVSFDEPVILKLDPEADAVRLDFARDIEPSLSSSGDLGHIADFAGKMTGTMLRIAGLLHLAAEPQLGFHRAISAETMTNAVTLARFYIEHGSAAFELMDRVDDGLATARQLSNLIRRRGLREFSASELHMLAGRSWLPDQATTNTAIEVLVDYGWIVPVEVEVRSGPGRRPSPRYRAHPDIFES